MIVAKTIEITKPGGPEVLKPGQRSVPTPGPGEVLLAVEAAGVNRPDIMQREGRYRPPPGASDVPGLEAAGEVIAVGADVPKSLLNQKMTALCPGGGYASHVTVPWQHALPWPRGYTAVQAAALPETCFTVYGNLFVRGQFQAGERVLIHGGSSGIGTTAIQMARSLGATQIIVTVRTEEKAQACRTLGADQALLYPDATWEDDVLALTDGAGVDVILDMVAGPYVARDQRCLATDGRLVLIASQGGSDARFDATVAMVRRQVITGSTLRPQSIEAKNQLAAGLKQQIWPLLNGGQIAPVIAATFPLEQAAQAHRFMESGKLIGKVVLTTQDP